MESVPVARCQNVTGLANIAQRLRSAQAAERCARFGCRAPSRRPAPTGSPRAYRRLCGPTVARRDRCGGGQLAAHRLGQGSARARRCRQPAPAANTGQRHRMSPASTYTCRIFRVSSRHPSTELLPPRSDEYRFWASRRAGPTARTGITPATIRPASHSRLRVKVNTRSPPCCRSVQQNT